MVRTDYSAAARRRLQLQHVPSGRIHHQRVDMLNKDKIPEFSASLRGRIADYPRAASSRFQRDVEQFGIGDICFRNCLQLLSLAH